MACMSEQLWVEAVGGLIIARLRGEPTEALLRACQENVLHLVREQGLGKVLYDVLEMTPPPAQLTFVQREMDLLHDHRLRRAIVVPDSKLAFLARMAFGEGDYQVFYNDMEAAITWLNTEASKAHLRQA